MSQYHYAQTIKQWFSQQLIQPWNIEPSILTFNIITYRNNTTMRLLNLIISLEKTTQRICSPNHLQLQKWRNLEPWLDLCRSLIEWECWNRSNVRYIPYNSQTFCLGIVLDQSTARTVPSTSLMTDGLVIHSNRWLRLFIYVRHISHRISHVYKDQHSQSNILRNNPIQVVFRTDHTRSRPTSDKPLISVAPAWLGHCQ